MDDFSVQEENLESSTQQSSGGQTKPPENELSLNQNKELNCEESLNGKKVALLSKFYGEVSWKFLKKWIEEKGGEVPTIHKGTRRTVFFFVLFVMILYY